MALYRPDGTKVTRKILYPDKYDPVRKRIPDSKFEMIKAALLDRIGQAGQEPFKGDGQIHTSSWIPGPDWSGTPYESIYVASQGGEELAAQVFGIILWQVFFDHPEPWGFGHYELDNIPIKGMTYFRIELPKPPSIAEMKEQLAKHFGKPG